MLPKGRVGAEIGVHVGDFSASLLKGTQPRELHLIDPWEHRSEEIYRSALYGGDAKKGQEEMDQRYQRVLARFARHPYVIVHRGYSNDVPARFADGYFDWIYVDGNHLYEYVRADLELSWRKVRVGGVIAGDDYGIVGWWDDGVKKAVDEFVAEDTARRLQVRNHQFILARA